MNDKTDPIRFSVPRRSAAERNGGKKLGKGLGALMGEVAREEPLVQSGSSQRGGVTAPPDGSINASPLKNLSVSSIEPLPGNPRKRFDESALDELAASIASRGVIQPIIVRPVGEGAYQLVAGERRWRAAQKAQLHEIPALVRDLGQREVMALALIENLQREDLNPVEEARAYQKLADDEGMTQAEIARMVEKSRSHIANIQRLLSLPNAVLDLVEASKLSMGHARALIGREDAVELAQRAVKDGLSVREMEKIVRKLAKRLASDESEARAPEVARTSNADIEAVQSHLEEFLGLPVRIKADADPRSGQITIRYRTLDQLDLVCQRLTGGDI
ncbi:MAG: ParB/RepB/Spo0J family partition protein [Pseudomonadota bacterium]